MAKAKTSASKSGAARKTKSPGTSDKMQQALRDAGNKAAELAQNPVARSMLAAGLVTAAAALTSSQKVRSTVRDASREALDNAEAAANTAADNASKIGAAIVTAATDAVRRLMAANGGTTAKRQGAASTATGATAKKTPAKKRTPRTAGAKTPAARKAAAPKTAAGASTASKPAARKKPATKRNPATRARKPAAKPAGAS